MSEKNDDELRRKNLRPAPDESFVTEVVQQTWGLAATRVKQLESYDDCNFYITVSGGDSYLVKFYNGVESENVDILKGLGGLCNALHENCGSEIAVPHPIMSINGLDIESVGKCPMANGEMSTIATRVFSWVEGNTLSAHGSTLELLREVGSAVGTATNALSDFDHPSFHRYHLWDLQQFQNVQPFISSIQDEPTKDRVHIIYDMFVSNVIPDALQFPKSVLLGDCNDANVIVSENECGTHVSGLIDFGDSCFSWTVNDLAIAIAYGIITKYGETHPLLTFATMVSGYCSKRKLAPIEIKHLHTLVGVRLAASASMGAYSISQDPTNEYLKLHALPAQVGLKNILAMNYTKVQSLLHLINSDTDEFSHCSGIIQKLMEIGEVSDSAAVKRYFNAPDESLAGRKRTRSSGNDESSLPTLTFVTGNARKLEEVKKILGDSLQGYRLISQKVDLPELQGNPEEVSAEKCKLAAAQVEGAVMVEDTSLCYNALGGLPGVYIKWFLEDTGLDGLTKLLSAYEDKSAYAQCIFSFHKNDGSTEKPRVFVGRCPGTIVEARGETRFGWDPIFQPDGFDKTFAEISAEEKNAISHRYKALCALREFLRNGCEAKL